MKKRRILTLKPLFFITALLVLSLLTMIFFLDDNNVLFYIGLGISVIVFALTVWRMASMSLALKSVVDTVINKFDLTDRAAVSSFPMPLVVCSENGEILWYNDLFLEDVLLKKEAYGNYIESVIDGHTLSDFSSQGNFSTNISIGDRFYSVFSSKVKNRANSFNVLYFNNDTELKKIAEEYALSRPCVMLFYIDSLDDLMQNSRESERAHISGKVESLLEDWASGVSGIIRKYSTERFLVVIEHRYFQKILLNKFEILDKVRKIKTSDDQSVTISIGVGQDETLKESEKHARQAIDMALGRGGDQASIKTNTGFDFYGGVSQGVEKQTKVRTRVVAQALSELIHGSDVVYIMGHRNSDLDCLGAGAALTSVIRGMGKQAFCVVESSRSLAYELIERYIAVDNADLFIEPNDVVLNGNRNILTIVTDTHNKKIVEYPPLLDHSTNVVVIDHHRKMVGFIDNAVIFYHEPNASSASEMVTELVQYMKGAKLSRLDAEALLAGIFLDTRGFVIKAGFRTFEAAAYLKRIGADTVKVKRLFSNSIDLYKLKNQIISDTQMYGQSAISVCEPFDYGGHVSENNIRIAASQAADELLYIDNVRASFIIFELDGSSNVSARSLGDYNVQLVMEDIGGGGHLTMAGAQLEGVTSQDAYNKLVASITTYLSKKNLTK